MPSIWWRRSLRWPATNINDTDHKLPAPESRSGAGFFFGGDSRIILIRLRCGGTRRRQLNRSECRQNWRQSRFVRCGKESQQSEDPSDSFVCQHRERYPSKLVFLGQVPASALPVSLHVPNTTHPIEMNHDRRKKTFLRLVLHLASRSAVLLVQFPLWL